MPSNSLPVPHYTQTSPGLCLPACARMVLAYLGRQVSEEELAQQLRSRPFGTYAAHIRYLANWGYQVIDEPGTPASLQSHLQNGHPCIAFVRTGPLPYLDEDVAHAVVVVGMSPDAFAVNDPAAEQAPLDVPREAFLLAWSEFDYRYAVILSPG
jgi:ABC-type bacteriocin/lantibiotic exporter with double-glycine peptidase domain